MTKQEWGNATWFLFHGLATKIKPEYPNEYKNILHYFIQICQVLPCPHCRDHATITNKKANLHIINSNKKLKDYLWQFHNRVNERLNKPLFSFEEHNNLYNTVRVKMIIEPFFSIMSAKVPAALMMESLQRQRILLDFYKYIKVNIYKFD